MSDWSPYLTRVQQSAVGLSLAGDVLQLLERARQTIEDAEVIRDLALLSARDQGIPWARLAQITGTTPNGVKHQHQRAEQNCGRAPQKISAAP